MKINKTKKSTRTIMSNSHFGGVLIRKGEVELFIPKEWIFKNGKMKKYAVLAWKKELAKHNLKKAV